MPSDGAVANQLANLLSVVPRTLLRHGRICDTRSIVTCRLGYRQLEGHNTLCSVLALIPLKDRGNNYKYTRWTLQDLLLAHTIFVHLTWFPEQKVKHTLYRSWEIQGVKAPTTKTWISSIQETVYVIFSNDFRGFRASLCKTVCRF
jgi:hypothetical protein